MLAAFVFGVLLLVGAAPAEASRSSWERVMLTDAAAKRGAVCLDGSPGGYFLKRGDPRRWILFMQGGGWCTSTAVRLTPTGCRRISHICSALAARTCHLHSHSVIFHCPSVSLCRTVQHGRSVHQASPGTHGWAAR